ncbi:MAG: hypothetical protein ACYC59_09265 [Anaerolineaceae bacterium]
MKLSKIDDIHPSNDKIFRGKVNMKENRENKKGPSCLLIASIIIALLFLIIIVKGLFEAKETVAEYRNTSTSKKTSSNDRIMMDCQDCQDIGMPIYLRISPDPSAEIIAGVPHGKWCTILKSGVSKADNRMWYAVDCGDLDIGWVVYTLVSK